MFQRNVRLTVVVAASLGLSCHPGFERNAGASEAQLRQRPTIASVVRDAPTITVEFDLPTDFFSRAPDGTFVIRGFRVGYFRPDGPLPVWTNEFRRDAATVNGQTVRLSLPRVGLPEGSNQVVVRISTVSRAGTSAWSEPSSTVTMPAAAPKPEFTARRGGRRHLVGSDLENYPALKSALDPLLTPDFPTDEVIRTFRRVDDLALAVVLSRRHQLSLTELCRAVQGPPTQSLRSALQRLRPSVDARRAFRDARIEARSLTVQSTRKRP